MRMTIGQAIGALAAADPLAVAVRCGDQLLTRRELDTITNQFARQWIERGVKVDDCVTISLENSIDFVLACVAAWKAGATPQPLSPRLAQQERSAVLELARPSLVIEQGLGRAGLDWAGLDWAELGRAGSTAPLPPLAASSWKAPTSSGSTGRPKLIRAAAAAYIDPDVPVASFIPHRAVQLVAGPLFHAAPFVYAMRGLMTGHQLVMMPRFEAAEWLRLVSEYRVTWGMLVPTMMARIWASPQRDETDVSSLECVLHLGARCAQDLKRSWIDWLGPERIYELYAGTESQGLALISGADWLEHPGSVGRGVGGTQFRVRRTDGQWAAPGEIGEIVMRRDTDTYHYVESSSTTHVSLETARWHSLGDAGWLDDEGWLYVADRLDDAITSGGITVHPAEVEETLEAHPAVVSAVVIGCPDPDRGERIHAVVHLTSALQDEQLQNWAAARLSPEKRPRSYHFVDHSLRDDTGKVRRSRLRETCR